MSEFSILYFAFVGNHFGGVEQKIMGQFDALVKIHPQTHLYLVSTDAPNDALKKEIHARENIYSLVNTIKKNPFKRRREKFSMIEKELQNYTPSNTIIYFRYPGADYLFYKFLRNVSDFKIITEHQEIENKLRIGKFSGNYGSDILDFIYGKKIRNLVFGFVGVSSQYLENQLSYLPKKIKNSKPVLVNGNGIEVHKYELRKKPVFNNKLLKILFVGSLFKSHGMHRLLKGIIKYEEFLIQKDLKIEIHIAGVNRSESYLSDYESNHLVADSVIYHGFLSRSELDRLANECHIAVNSLGLHRIGLSVTSTLKSREYFARGIPFITSSDDNDFSNNNLFIHKIPSDESPVNIPDLFSFTSSVFKLSNHSEEMRNYAENFLDWKHKMNNLYSFLQSNLEK